MCVRFVRRADFVRPLGADTEVTAEDAFVDKIDLSIGYWALLGDEDAICSAMEHLRQHTLIQTPYGEVLPVFQGELIKHVHDIRHLRFTANPRTDNLDRAHTLVSGTVEFATWGNRPTSRLEDERARLNFRTKLNQTRFVQAQHLQRISHPERPALAADYVLAITPEDRWYRDEIPLLPATNVIIGPSQKYAYALKNSRRAQFRRYISLVHSMLQSSLDVAFDDEDAEARQLPNFVLHSIEFYWEFDHDNPIDYVITILPLLRQQAVNATDAVYAVSLPELGIECQSPCIKIALTKTIELKVYAKTNRRVRFEVSFKDAAVGKHGGGQTATSIRELSNKIPSLATEAAKRCNKVLQSITAAPPPPSTIGAFELMHAIYKQAQNQYVAETIVASLVSFRRITPYNNDPLRETIHRLRDNGVLRTIRPKSRNYVVTDRYYHALERLRTLR